MSVSRRAFAAALLGAGVAACKPKPSEQRIVLGFSQLGTQNSWRLANTESIRSAAATSNIELRVAFAQRDQEQQIAAMRQFIADQVDVIAFAPLVPKGWDGVLLEAKAAGIPVILTDSPVDSDPALYAGFLGPDFVEEGRKAARWAASQFPASLRVNVVQLEGRAGSSAAVERKQGFEDVLAQHPNLRLLKSLVGDFSRQSGESVMAAFLASESQHFHVLFAHNDDMALGAIQAIEAAGRRPGKDIRIVSVDGMRAAFEAMIAGKLNATIECNPLLGPQLMTSVTQAVAGRAIPKRMIVDETIFTPEMARQLIHTRKY